MVLKADALHYKTDLYTNAGIIVSLGAVALTGYGLIDPFVGIVIAVYIIASAFGIIKEGLLTLMDRAIDEHFVVEICKLIPQANSKVRSFHHLRTRHSANMMFVDVHVVFDDKILLAEAHKIGDEIEDAIRSLDEHAKWVININLDPRDDSQKDMI
jgi:cation diffusion facilitator family transporter